MQPGFSLAPRDPFADAQQTLSSWDNCMAKDYCKWPVIVAIVIGGLIAFSIVFCIARCICCGAECAICCCKCCTCCCGSSDSGHRRMKSDNQGYPPQPYPPQQYPPPQPQQPYAQPNPYAEARSFAPPPPPPPQINTQYASHATPVLARQPSNPHFNPQTNPKFVRPASPEQPQFATFDAHAKPANEDALPAMPSWSDARSRQVEVEDAPVRENLGDVEMDRLNHNGSVPSAGVAGVAGAVGAGMRASPGPAGGRSQYERAGGMARNANASPGYQDQYERGGGMAMANASPGGYQDQYDRRGSPAQNHGLSPGGYQDQYDRRPSPTLNTNISPGGYHDRASPAHLQSTSPYGQPPRGPSPAQSYSQYSQASSPHDYDRPSPLHPQPYTQPYTQPYQAIAQHSPYTPSERYNSPAPPSYHTNAPTAYAPSAPAPYDPVPERSQTTTPAYPGQVSYQAFQPQSPQGVARRPVAGSARDV